MTPQYQQRCVVDSEVLLRHLDRQKNPHQGFCFTQMPLLDVRWFQVLDLETKRFQAASIHFRMLCHVIFSHHKSLETPSSLVPQEKQVRFQGSDQVLV